MRTILFFLSFFLLSQSAINAQNKDISLEDIWQKHTFSQERLEALRSLKNGEEYTVMDFNRAQRSVSIEAFSYKTGEKTRTIINSNAIPHLDYFQTYSFNDEETAVLLGKDINQIYRHSFEAIFYVYDLEKEALNQISTHKIKEPTFSPDGKKVAYAFENNLYVKDLKTDETLQLTKDGKRNQIINGTTDWVYEEEFAFTRAYDWSPDGTKIGYLKFDESEVPEITMEIYGDSPQEQLYPEPYKFKYPKAGDPNSVVSLHLYDLKTQTSKKVDFKKDYEYFPRIQWTNDPNMLSIQAMNRHQNDLDLIFVNADNHSI